jgi:hypothetical protein
MATPLVLKTTKELMAVMVKPRPATLLVAVGTISVAKKLHGYAKVIRPPTGSRETVVNDSVTDTPLLAATRSELAMARDTDETFPPALLPGVG